MRGILVLLCFGFVGCASVETGVAQLKGAASGLAGRIDAAFSGPTDLYGEMTDTDVALAVAAMQLALETKASEESVGWINDETGNEGSIMPRRAFVTDRGVFCRAYDEHLIIGDRDGVIRNTACRTGDGDWTWTS